MYVFKKKLYQFILNMYIKSAAFISMVKFNKKIRIF